MATRRTIGQAAALVGFLAVVGVAAAAGSAATVPNLRPWYDGLRKPWWTPPNWAFGPAWTTLYVLMAVSAWRVWRRDPASPKARRDALTCWAFQLALNVGWSWLFFGLRNPTLAFFELMALWVAILATAVAAWKVDRPAAWLLAPYLLWVTYAGSLNGAIVRLNS